MAWSNNPEARRAHKLGCQFAAKRRKRKKPEQVLQTAVARYLDRALRKPTWWSGIGHGGGGRVRGAILKGMGVKAGVPDLLIVHPAPMNNSGCLLVGIELKSADGSLSPAQKETRDAFTEAGAFYYIARSLDEVEGFLRGIGIPLHATTGMREAAA